MAAASFPSPASGSAAATVAAMALALLEMSCKVTMKKSGENLPISLNELGEIRQQCLYLATEDMITLTEVVRAAKSKADFPDRYENAVKKATEPLVAIVENCELILTLIEQLIDNSSKKVLGELAGSAYMAEAAAASAKLGIEINLGLLNDENYKEDVMINILGSYRKGTEAKDRILKNIKL
jgi:formiminotetrahydrofolate cyclodeaminase